MEAFSDYLLIGDLESRHEPSLVKDYQFRFFPGILRESDSKEDEVVSNDKYFLRLGSVRTNATGSLLDQKLVKRYEWAKLEKIILKHLGKCCHLQK